MKKQRPQKVNTHCMSRPLVLEVPSFFWVSLLLSELEDIWLSMELLLPWHDLCCIEFRSGTFFFSLRKQFRGLLQPPLSAPSCISRKYWKISPLVPSPVWRPCPHMEETYFIAKVEEQGPNMVLFLGFPGVEIFIMKTNLPSSSWLIQSSFLHEVPDIKGKTEMFQRGWEVQTSGRQWRSPVQGDN